MRTKDSEEWSRYAVGAPSQRPNWTNPDCQPFDTVYHICHIEDACRIFEDRRIRSSLVWDESKLRNTRTCVSWVSPNRWYGGSIYGSIRFEFDWQELIAGKRFFWVEGMNRYNPAAYRILISGNDHEQSGLTPYRSRNRNGPLFFDSKAKVWYRNGNFTGEFLIDDDLWLEECRKVGFEDHHPRICRAEEGSCKYLEKKRREAGAALLGRLIGHNIARPKKLFLDSESKHTRLHDEAAEAWAHLKKSLRVQKGQAGTLAHDHPAALYLATAILDRFGSGRPKGAQELCNLFRSTEELSVALTNRGMNAFGMHSAGGLQG